MDAELEAKVAKVAANKDAWTRVEPARRVALLRGIVTAVVAAAERWVQVGCEVKGVDPASSLAGEEWLVGPVATARNARLLAETIDAVVRTGSAPAPARVVVRDDGQVVARVMPRSFADRALFTGYTADVWIQRGKEATQAAAYRAGASALPGRACLVLGGGNVSSIPAMDVLCKLFVENQVVVLKTNPVLGALAPVLEQVFAPLVEAGFVAVVSGDGEVGAHLAAHPEIDTLHVTGSERTYDAIVWGDTPEEREERKRMRAPRNHRAFTAELGCVTPIVVVPGPWSAADMEFHARNVAAMVAHNASFNCNAAKVLVVARGWLQREAFLRRLDAALARLPPRRAYYPGAEDRYRAFLERYSDAKVVGAAGETPCVPWTVLPNVSPNEGEYALTHEAFCGVLAVVTLDATTPTELLERAVPFVNDRVHGTLSAGLVVHPSTVDEHGAAVDRAVADLRYGAVALNAWPAVAYALGVTPWGAFPGQRPEEIGSGAGVVHNTMMFDHPEKCVVRAPFRIRPTPPWFPDHPNLAEVGRRLLAFEAEPTLGAVARVASAAVFGRARA